MILKRIVLSFLVIVFLLSASAAAFVFFAVGKTPLVTSHIEFNAENIARAKKILSANNPQKLASGEQYTVEFIQQDLELALNYLASRAGNGAVEILLSEGFAKMDATVKLPSNPLGNFLNLTLALDTSKEKAFIQTLKLGRVNVPGFLAGFLIRLSLKILPEKLNSLEAVNMIRNCRSTEGKIALVYVWNDTLADRVKAAVVPADEQARWKVYHMYLVELTSGLKNKKTVSLADLLLPMLRLSGERASQSTAVAENRSVLVVLASYVTGRSLTLLVSGAKDWPAPERLGVTLAGRDDFPQHFIISAAMAASADSSFSDAVGLYKEINDSQGGSGFSFNDMASDRAGVRFGELATASEASALNLQKKILSGLKESDILPKVSDLPEFLTEAEFKKRYGGVGESEYVKMMAEIENRVASLPLYR